MTIYLTFEPSVSSSTCLCIIMGCRIYRTFLTHNMVGMVTLKCDSCCKRDQTQLGYLLANYSITIVIVVRALKQSQINSLAKEKLKNAEVKSHVRL